MLNRANSSTCCSWTQVQTRCSQLITPWMGDNKNKWLSSRQLCLNTSVCVIGVGSQAGEEVNTSLATSASVCPCEGAEEEKGGGLGVWVRGLPFNADYQPIRGSQTVKDCRGEGVGSSEADPAGQLSPARRHRRRSSQISFAQLRSNCAHLSMRRCHPTKAINVFPQWHAYSEWQLLQSGNPGRNHPPGKGRNKP